MSGRKSWLEMVMKRKTFNESPLEVIAIEDASSVVGKGENYFSEIERVIVTVLLGSGKMKKISLIIKNRLETEQMKRASVELGVFVKEITMYRDVLPKMEDLLDEINDPEGIMWGRCFDFKLYDQLVFEDLKVAGYTMADRKKQHGLQSALLVLKNLAKFHALSVILLEREQVPVDIFRENLFNHLPEHVEHGLKRSGECLINVMKTWGGDWEEATERFRKSLPDLGKRFLEEVTAKPGEFKVLCHADCWTNNMMFKGEDLENPTSVKFVDMQLTTIASPAYDFHYFVGRSVRPEVIKSHYDDLIQQYSKVFRSFLTKLGYKGDIPSYEELKELFVKKCVIMLGSCVLLGHFSTNDTSNQPSMEEQQKQRVDAAAEGRETEPLNHFQNLNEGCKNMYQSCIKKCIELGTI